MAWIPPSNPALLTQMFKDFEPFRWMIQLPFELCGLCGSGRRLDGYGDPIPKCFECGAHDEWFPSEGVEIIP